MAGQPNSCFAIFIFGDTMEDVKPESVTAVQEKLDNSDIQALEIAKLNRKVALKEAEKALAENKSAELAYHYLVLQMYLKYGLSVNDSLDEQGNIKRAPK